MENKKKELSLDIDVESLQYDNFEYFLLSDLISKLNEAVELGATHFYLKQTWEEATCFEFSCNREETDEEFETKIKHYNLIEEQEERELYLKLQEKYGK